MKKLFCLAGVMVLIILAVGLPSGSAHAELIYRGRGLIYDTYFDLTWYKHVNMTYMYWSDAMAWASNLNINGITGWRLPSAIKRDGSGPCIGFSEMTEFGHLYSTELGNIFGSGESNSYGPFEGTAVWGYSWTNTSYDADPTKAYMFSPGGEFFIAEKNPGTGIGWAVHDGDCLKDTDAPILEILSPTTDPIYSTNLSILNLDVKAMDEVETTGIVWTNDRGGSGICQKKSLLPVIGFFEVTVWDCHGITLSRGQNIITVTARDVANNLGIGALTVTYTDIIYTTATITSPTSDPTYSTSSSLLTIGGTASNDVGVTGVTWANARGGSGNCDGTTSWSCGGIALFVGQNVITVTASDEAGNPGTDTLTVTYTPPVGAPDFLITSISLTPTFILPSSTIDATVTIKNQGLGSADAGYLDIWKNRDGTAGCGASGDIRVSVGVLAAGETRTFSFFNLPTGAEGNRTFRAFVDSTCNTSESNEGNNQKTFPYQVKAGCNYSLTPEVWAFNASGGIGSFSVTTREECAWVPVSNSNWLLHQTGSIGPGTLYYSVLPNNSGKARIGNISVQGQNFTILQAKSDFVDVDSDYWANSWIYAAYASGLASGYGNGYFGSEDYVTREQMAVLIIRALNEMPEDGYCGATDPFLDVSFDRWSCKYIIKLEELGITSGYGDGRFGPEDVVTREQMAVFILKARAAVPPDGYCEGTDPFTDVSFDRWSCKYVKELAELGITTGYGDGRFGPEDYVTRAQMAIFLSRAFLGM